MLKIRRQVNLRRSIHWASKPGTIPVHAPKTSALETEVSELKTLVNNLLDKANKLTAENTGLREEIRHLKKLKGQPKIRPNKKPPEDGKDNKDSKPASASGTTSSIGKTLALLRWL